MVFAVEWDDGAVAVAADGVSAIRVDGVWSEIPLKVNELDSGWTLVTDETRASALLKEARKALAAKNDPETGAIEQAATNRKLELVE